MTAVLGLVAVIYGASLLMVAAGLLLSGVSPAFRRMIVDPRASGS